MEISLKHLDSQTIRARDSKFVKKLHLPQPVTCHVSDAMCHMSCVMCHHSCKMLGFVRDPCLLGRRGGGAGVEKKWILDPRIQTFCGTDWIGRGLPGGVRGVCAFVSDIGDMEGMACKVNNCDPPPLIHKMLIFCRVFFNPSLTCTCEACTNFSSLGQ